MVGTRVVAARDRRARSEGRGRDRTGEHDRDREVRAGGDADERQPAFDDDDEGTGVRTDALEPPMEREQLVRAGDARAEEHREPAYRPEPEGEQERGSRARAECGEHDQQVDARRHDVRREADADLPAEPDAVHPRPVLAEPDLVDLPGVHRQPEAEQAQVGGERDGCRERRERDGDVAGEVDGGHAEGEQRGARAEGRAAGDRADDEPGRGGREAVAAPRSASGVTVDSIDSPHGDHVERTATATASSAAPATRPRFMTSPRGTVERGGPAAFLQSDGTGDG